MNRVKTAGIVLAGSLALVSLAGCAAEPPTGAEVGAIEVASAPTAEEFASAVSPAEVNQVYYQTPRELLLGKDLVVRGRVSSVSTGPSYAPADMPQNAMSTFYIEISPDDVVVGDYPMDESVWVLINWVGPGEQAVWEKFLPHGTPVVAYLTEIDLSSGLVDPESEWQLTPDSRTDLPGNGRLWIPNSQGLAFDVGGAPENLTWPLLGTSGSGDLADTLPDGTLIGLPPSHREN